MTVIEFAEKRYRECCEKDFDDARYWAAYLEGARAQLKEDTNVLGLPFLYYREGCGDNSPCDPVCKR